MIKLASTGRILRTSDEWTATAKDALAQHLTEDAVEDVDVY